MSELKRMLLVLLLANPLAGLISGGVASRAGAAPLGVSCFWLYVRAFGYSPGGECIEGSFALRRTLALWPVNGKGFTLLCRHGLVAGSC